MEIARPQLETCVLRPGLWGRIGETVASVYCRVMHGAISRPYNGRYVCWTCLREFPVKW
jgi:hypothetical protein